MFILEIYKSALSQRKTPYKFINYKYRNATDCYYHVYTCIKYNEVKKKYSNTITHKNWVTISIKFNPNYGSFNENFFSRPFRIYLWRAKSAVKGLIEINSFDLFSAGLFANDDIMCVRNIIASRQKISRKQSKLIRCVIYWREGDKSDLMSVYICIFFDRWFDDSSVFVLKDGCACDGALVPSMCMK